MPKPVVQIVPKPTVQVVPNPNVESVLQLNVHSTMNSAGCASVQNQSANNAPKLVLKDQGSVQRDNTRFYSIFIIIISFLIMRMISPGLVSRLFHGEAIMSLYVLLVTSSYQ